MSEPDPDTDRVEGHESTEASPYQDRYWKELYQLRVHVNYLEIYLSKSEGSDRCLNIFLAVTSNSSICGWAIWSNYSMVWGGIIAVSQLLNAIKQFLPYRTRMKAIDGVLREFEELLISSEMRWFDVAEGNLTDEEINKVQFEIRQRKVKSLQKHLGESLLPTKSKYFVKANQLAAAYVNHFYGGD